MRNIESNPELIRKGFTSFWKDEHPLGVVWFEACLLEPSFGKVVVFTIPQ